MPPEHDRRGVLWANLHTQWRSFWWLFRRALVSSYEDNCLGIAKGAAYSGLLAFFPVLTSLTAILVQANAGSLSRIISGFVFKAVPPGTEEIVLYNFTERGQRPLYLIVVASLLAIWAGSGLMMSLMQGFQAAYRIPTGRPFVQQRLMAMLLVITAAVPLVASSVLIVFGARVERSVFHWIGLVSDPQQIEGGLLLVSQVARNAVTFGGIILGACLMYYLGPNSPKRLRSVWPGAILATVLWWLTTTAFGYYVRNIANYNFLYGSIGAVIALLVWMYLLSIIALIGCEYNAERDRWKSDRLAI
jgi:membrane protein